MLGLLGLRTNGGFRSLYSQVVSRLPTSDDSVDTESEQEEEDGSGGSSGVGAFAVLGRLCSMAGISVLVDS